MKLVSLEPTGVAAEHFSAALVDSLKSSLLVTICVDTLAEGFTNKIIFHQAGQDVQCIHSAVTAAFCCLQHHHVHKVPAYHLEAIPAFLLLGERLSIILYIGCSILCIIDHPFKINYQYIYPNTLSLTSRQSRQLRQSKMSTTIDSPVHDLPLASLPSVK